MRPSDDLAEVYVCTEPVDFRKDVAPILEQHCLRCHDDVQQKGDLSLATRAWQARAVSRPPPSATP